MKRTNNGRPRRSRSTPRRTAANEATGRASSHKKPQRERGTSTPATEARGVRQLQLLCLLAIPFLVVMAFHERITMAMQAATNNKPVGFLDSLGLQTFLTAKHAPLNAVYYLCALEIALSAPHVLYYFVWTNPRAFMRIVRERLGMRTVPPYKVFAYAAHALKLFQLCAVITYLYAIGFLSSFDFVRREMYASMNPYKLLLAVELIVLGQILNAAVYARIGEAGVYYGIRLESPRVPWCHAFPFNVISHAQYTGAVLSIWGMLLLLTTEKTTTWAFPQVTFLTMFIYYAFSSYVEDKL